MVSGEVNLQTLNAEQKEYLCISLFIRKIVLYNDKIEIHFNTPLRNGPNDDRGLFLFCWSRISSKLKCWQDKT